MSEPAQPETEPLDHGADGARSGRGTRALIMSVLVLGLAGVALMVMERGTAPTATGLPLELDDEPDFYMEGAEVSQYRSDGTLEYRLLADDVQHFEPQAITRLARPQLTLYRPQQPSWQARAERGVLRRPPQGADEERLELAGEVILEQQRPNGEHLRLTTPALTIYPRRQYAETDRDVMIDSLVGRTAATGLEGDLQLGMLKFSATGSSRVHTVLQPEHFK